MLKHCNNLTATDHKIRIFSYLCVGYFSLMEEIMSCSTFWSVSVTRSTGELFCMTAMSFWSASRIIWQEHNNDKLRKGISWVTGYICYFNEASRVLCYGHILLGDDDGSEMVRYNVVVITHY